MQTYLALCEISLCLAHARLIAQRSGASLVVRLVELTLKQTRQAAGFEPRPPRAPSLCLSASLFLSLSIVFFLSVCIMPLLPPMPLSIMGILPLTLYNWESAELWSDGAD